VPQAAGAIVACAEAGAAGFVTEEETIEDLARAITNAARDELDCSPIITAALARRLAVLAGDEPNVDATQRLTRREAEISEFLRRGLSNKEIASRLQIEVTTVKNHVHNILEKLGLSRRAEIARLFERAAGPPSI
jgi:DNA-binding NarL/FixJ family response regulator